MPSRRLDSPAHNSNLHVVLKSSAGQHRNCQVQVINLAVSRADGYPLYTLAVFRLTIGNTFGRPQKGL